MAAFERLNCSRDFFLFLFKLHTHTHNQIFYSKLIVSFTSKEMCVIYHPWLVM